MAKSPCVREKRGIFLKHNFTYWTVVLNHKFQLGLSLLLTPMIFYPVLVIYTFISKDYARNQEVCLVAKIDLNTVHVQVLLFWYLAIWSQCCLKHVKSNILCCQVQKHEHYCFIIYFSVNYFCCIIMTCDIFL